MRLQLSMCSVAFLLSLTAVGVAQSDDGVEEGQVRVGMLVYGDGLTGTCFSSRFLADVARRTAIRTVRQFEWVDLADEAIFDHPFVIMSGTGLFDLPTSQRQNLLAYLRRGGFLLASAGCSNDLWAVSFRSVIEDLFGNSSLQPLSLEHPIFRSLYEIDRLPTRQPSDSATLLGLEIEGRLAMVYSPVGLNDTARAGAGCCCCGGNELRHASQINANVLVYVLTH